MNMKTCRRAFTLVELLVVIGIIALLISILLPVLKRARDSALSVACSSNQRQLMLAFRLFADEHKGHLPGNFVDYDQTDKDKRAWLMNYQDPLTAAPQIGTIYRYLKNKNVYRCPAQEAIVAGVGAGSNGHFDYAAFGVFTGALMTKIRNESTYTFNGKTQSVPTPIICEEGAVEINGGNIEGLHNSIDPFSTVHRGGAYYATVDGSIQWFREPPGSQGATNWSSRGPSGAMVSLGTAGFGIRWGWWNSQ
jgi:prepilin-type N-terminal cleavage/methylation domain-containing protein